MKQLRRILPNCFSILLSFQSFFFPPILPLQSSFSSSVFLRDASIEAFHESICCADVGKSAQQRHCNRHVAITIYLNIDRKANQVGTTLLCRTPGDAYGTLQCYMHKRSINQDESCDLIPFCTAVLMHKMKSHAHFRNFHIFHYLPHTLSTLLVCTHGTVRNWCKQGLKQTLNVPAPLQTRCQAAGSQLLSTSTIF